MNGFRITALIVALVALGLGVAAGNHYLPFIGEPGIATGSVGRVFLPILVLFGIAVWLWRR